MGTTIPISFKTIKAYFWVQVFNIGGVVKDMQGLIESLLSICNFLYTITKEESTKEARTIGN